MSNVRVLDSIRDWVSPNDNERRSIIRSHALDAAEQARAEIQKSKDLRELMALEQMYNARLRGRGVTRKRN